MFFSVSDDDWHDWKRIFDSLIAHSSLEWLIEEFKVVERFLDGWDSLTGDEIGHEGCYYMVEEYLTVLAFAVCDKCVAEYCMSAV